jgi:carbamate kinase
MSKTAVVAIGGNALTRDGELGTQEEQYKNAMAMGRSVRSLIRQGWRVVVVHGNGPQVGNLAIQHEEGARLVPAQPLFVLDAMTQGAIGSMISLALHEVCGSEISGVVSVITHVVVDPNDPAFSRPTKPIGPFFTEAEMHKFTRERKWTMISDSGRGFRRVVASPQPQATLEAAAIATLIDTGYIVVAAGGGGIPVVRRGNAYCGIDAVVDKDFAAERIADAANAAALVMVTGVPTVLLDFGLPTERPVEQLFVDEARRYLAEGQFPLGSMGPKMAAAIKFIEGQTESGVERVAAITTPELVYTTLDSSPHGVIEGNRGTRIVHNPVLGNLPAKELAG